MLSIGAGIVGGQTQQVQRTFDRLADTSVKLATLKRINRGSDDPAGLIAATELNRELTALEEASAATERTRAVVHLADRGLGQASDLLNQIEGNLVASASGATSTDERAAHQIEIDAAVDALDRIGLSTTFAGRQVFTGEEISVLTGPNPTDSARSKSPVYRVRLWEVLREGSRMCGRAVWQVITRKRATQLLRRLVSRSYRLAQNSLLSSGIPSTRRSGYLMILP